MGVRDGAGGGATVSKLPVETMTYEHAVPTQLSATARSITMEARAAA